MNKVQLQCVINFEDEEDVMTWEYNDIRKFFIKKLKANEISYFHVSSAKQGSFKFTPWIQEILDEDDDAASSSK